jgi:hypothetical protein
MVGSTEIYMYYAMFLAAKGREGLFRERRGGGQTRTPEKSLIFIIIPMFPIMKLEKLPASTTRGKWESRSSLGISVT